jgi:hypothetical protein
MVKKKIGNFMAQQFSLSRKLCQSDKQSIENFITEQIREVQRQCHRQEHFQLEMLTNNFHYSRQEEKNIF